MTFWKKRSTMLTSWKNISSTLTRWGKGSEVRRMSNIRCIMENLSPFSLCLWTIRAVCRKHELIQYELELAAQDLAYKKQQKEELVTGVMLPWEANHHPQSSEMFLHNESLCELLHLCVCVCTHRLFASFPWRGWQVNYLVRRARSRGRAGWQPWSRTSRKERQRWSRRTQSASEINMNCGFA